MLREASERTERGFIVDDVKIKPAVLEMQSSCIRKKKQSSTIRLTIMRLVRSGGIQ